MIQSLAGNDVSHTLDQWLSLESGFDQCGAMYGQITVDGGVNGIERNTIEVNLPGVRRVRLGNANQIGSCSEESATTFGVGSDGTVFVLSTAITDDCTEYVSVAILNAVFDIQLYFWFAEDVSDLCDGRMATFYQLNEVSSI